MHACIDLGRVHLLRLVSTGATLTLKLKTETFDLRTRDSSAGRLVGSAAGLLARALPALERELRHERGVKLRLLGVRVSRLQREGEQPADGTRRIDVLWRSGGGGSGGGSGGGGGGSGGGGGGGGSCALVRQETTLALTGGGGEEGGGFVAEQGERIAWYMVHYLYI